MRSFFLSLSWLTAFHCLLFGLFWTTNRSYYRDVNEFLGNMVGRPMAYVTIFLGFSLFVLICSLAAILVVSRHWKSNPGGFGPAVWIYAGLAVFYVVLFYGSFIMLFRESPVQLARLGLLWGYFRLLPDGVLLLVLAWLVGGFVSAALASLMGAVLARWVSIGIVLVGWALPLFFLPSNVYQGGMPTKPVLIAHRGAAWLAPENTKAAMEKAVENGVFGLESDVHLSRDGVLFLMHDANLKRTTDVEVVYPGRESDHASLFSWDELSQLNAGVWFTSEDPYGTIASGQVSQQEVDVYAKAGIPKLDEFLDIGKENGKIVLYDLYDPPEDHPLQGRSLEYSLNLLKEAQLGERIWLLAREAEIDEIGKSLPDATLAAGIDSANPPEAEGLIEAGYTVVNSEYSLPDREIANYKQAGLWVNLYTVDEGWQFSRLWLKGADSVTSNNVQGLEDLDRPVLGFPVWVYRGIWAVVGLAALVLAWARTAR